MGDYTEFQTTANANTASPPTGAPEGMAPSTVNDTMREMMAVIRLLGDKSNATASTAIIDGTNNLTADQAKALIYRFTGALTATAGVVFPANFVGWALVHNDTTGGFTLNCSVSGQGVIIDNQEVAMVISDGTDMVRFVGSEWDACCVIVKGPIRQEIPVDANIILGDANTLANPTSGSGVNNIAIGPSAMEGAKVATQNVVIGPFAGADLSGTGPNDNVFIGEAAGQNVRDGSGNSAVGQGAMRSQAGTPLTGSNNTALGQGALNSIEGAAAGNTALGQLAGTALTTGSNNLLSGKGAAPALTTGNNNTVLGVGAASALLSGGSNVIIGENAGDTLITGSGNIVIGQGADVAGGASANTMNIGNTLYGTGVGQGTPGNIGIGTTAPAFPLDVNGVIRAQGDIITDFGTILSNAAGAQGQMHIDSGFLYICVGTNTWKRVALSSF